MNLRAFPSLRLVGCSLTLAAVGGVQAGALDLEPYVTGEIRHESNLFRLSRTDEQTLGVRAPDDTVQRYTFGVEARYERAQQSLSGRVEGQRQRYRHNEALDHNGHRFVVDAETGLPGPFRLTLGYSDERRLAAFEDRRSTEPSLENEREARGELRLALSDRYSLFGGTRHRQLDSPIVAAPARLLPPPGVPARPASPDFSAREAAYALGVAYGLGGEDDEARPISVRVGLEHQEVSFDDLNRLPGEPRPAEDGYELLVLGTEWVYLVSGLSTLEATVGATRYRDRDSAGDSPIELTGDIGYRRALSALTELEIGLFRRIELLNATADTTTDTGYRLGIRWSPLPPLQFSARHERSESVYEGLSGIAPDNRGRKDRNRFTEVGVDYPLWLSSQVRLFGRFGERVSRSGGDDYRDDRYGVELTLQWP